MPDRSSTRHSIPHSSIPQSKRTFRRVCMLAASFTIGTFVWFLLGDSDSLVAEEPPRKSVVEESVLAEVGGIPVTESEVRSLVSDELEALEAERRRLMEAALEVRVRELVVEIAAAERGVTPAELIALEVDQKLDQVPQEEVDRRLGALEGEDPPEATAELELRRSLRMEAFVNELERRPDVQRAVGRL